jgi:hypothetical protein
MTMRRVFAGHACLLHPSASINDRRRMRRRLNPCDGRTSEAAEGAPAHFFFAQSAI